MALSPVHRAGQDTRPPPPPGACPLLARRPVALGCPVRVTAKCTHRALLTWTEAVAPAGPPAPAWPLCARSPRAARRGAPVKGDSGNVTTSPPTCRCSSSHRGGVRKLLHASACSCPHPPHPRGPDSFRKQRPAAPLSGHHSASSPVSSDTEDVASVLIRPLPGLRTAWCVAGTQELFVGPRESSDVNARATLCP